LGVGLGVGFGLRGCVGVGVGLTGVTEGTGTTGVTEGTGLSAGVWTTTGNGFSAGTTTGLVGAGGVLMGANVGVAVGVTDGVATGESVGIVVGLAGLLVGLGLGTTTTVPAVDNGEPPKFEPATGWFGDDCGDTTALDPMRITLAVATVVMPTSETAATTVLVEVAANAGRWNAAPSFTAAAPPGRALWY
jgi:hypothetical protein